MNISGVKCEFMCGAENSLGNVLIPGRAVPGSDPVPAPHPAGSGSSRGLFLCLPSWVTPHGPAEGSISLRPQQNEHSHRKTQKLLSSVQGHLALFQAAARPIQPGLGHLQGWSSQDFSGSMGTAGNGQQEVSCSLCCAQPQQGSGRQRMWEEELCPRPGAVSGVPKASRAKAEEASRAREEDEQLWEDGDSSHQRLGEAQLQNPLRLKQRQGTFGVGKSQSRLLWERKTKDGKRLSKRCRQELEFVI